MEGNRGFLFPITPFYSGLQQIPTLDQPDQIFPLVNSAVASNEMDDEEIARQHQERLYAESLMEVDEPLPNVASSFNPRRLEEIDADAAYALQLQEEEYSRHSIIPSRSHKRESDNRKSLPIIIDSDDEPVVSDADYAAHLQAEENQRGQRRRQRPSYPPRQTTNRTFQSNDVEVIPMPPFAGPTHNRPSSSGHSNDVSTLLQLFASRGRGRPVRGFPRGGGRRNRDIQRNTEDFGPDDYERLLELDNAVGADSLTEEQINRLPTEKFHRPKNTNDEENKCSVCWDEFEQNQILRRLRCFHLYHKDCIDNWLKVKNHCPVCRIPPIE